MIGKEDVVDAIRYPSLLCSVINRQWTRLVDGSENESGIDIFEKDWDVLAILDACRFDYFVEHSKLSGDLSRVESKGSATPEWMRANFKGRDLTDTVYISANPWYSQLRQELDCTFHKYEEVTRDKDEYAPFPQSVTDSALEAIRSYPRKRILVHYMQPHRPYQSEWAQGWIDQTGRFQSWVKENGFSTPDVRKAYEENVKLVLDGVERLIEETEGRVVISSDHGELLNDRMSPIPIRRYGHPRGVYVPKLVRVPWLINETGERRNTKKDPPREEMSTSGRVEKRLQELGYV